MEGLLSKARLWRRRRELTVCISLLPEFSLAMVREGGRAGLVPEDGAGSYWVSREMTCWALTDGMLEEEIASGEAEGEPPPKSETGEEMREVLGGRSEELMM